ncbi:MAG: HAD family phosphatase [Chloroflexi bacterium]|nr:HAD family phosphatase [Chloroflexota bacterium]
MLDANYNYAILWDMDGVLVNTGEYHYKAWKKTFQELGISFSEDQFRETFGMNNTGILEIIFGQNLVLDEVQKISNCKESLFREAIRGNANLLPGIDNALKKCATWKFKQAIASSAPPKNIEILVKELKIGNYFDALVSGFDIPGKPDPGVFIKAAHSVGILQKNCIVIEDAVAGVDGAKAAGMKCIAITTTNTAETLSNADLVLDSLEDLKKNTLVDLFD